MKRIIGALLLVAVLSAMLAGCGLTVPRPEVKSGEFDVSVTYEENGESKTLDLVFVCEYEGIGWTLEGAHYRDWKGYFKGYGEGDVIEICTTEDGGKVALCILIYPEYFMGELGYDENLLAGFYFCASVDDLTCATGHVDVFHSVTFLVKIWAYGSF